MNKSTIIALIFLALLAAGALLVNREMQKATARPAVQRQLSQTRLAEFVAGIKAHQAAHEQAWPATMKDILRAAKLPVTATAVRGAGLYHYKCPSETDGPDTVIIWSDRPYDAIAVGDPYGAEGQVAEQPVPAAAYMVTKALEIIVVSPDEWVKRKPKGSNTGAELGPAEPDQPAEPAQQ